MKSQISLIYKIQHRTEEEKFSRNGTKWRECVIRAHFNWFCESEVSKKDREYAKKERHSQVYTEKA